MSDLPNDSLSGELKKLGENLKISLRTAWESDQRKNAARGLEEGLSELTRSFEDVTKEIRESETTQKIREDLQDFQSRISTGEVETKLRSELVASLKLINDELSKFTNRWSSHPPADDSSSPAENSASHSDSGNQ